LKYGSTELDLRAPLEHAFAFVQEHPWVSLGIAAAAIFLACNIPTTSYQQA
jgi:ElaB/YqjD/DUF883 family membrane-anchored ribosome-binding protein